MCYSLFRIKEKITMKTDRTITPSSSHQLIEVLKRGYIQPSLESPLTPESSISGVTQKDKLSLFFSIVNQSVNAIAITNADKDIIYVNKKFEELSGYALSEVLGKNPRVLKSNKTPAGTYRDMHRKLQAGSPWKGVFINTHRNGNEYIEEVVISPITDETGEVICYLAEKKNIAAQRAAEDRVLKLTHFDSLTELPNRAYFIEEANMLTSFQATTENSFAILFADLDRFKELNDSSGHLAGDMALQEVARRIEQTLPPGDFVARVGGDEFVVLHRRATQDSTAQLSVHLAAALSQPIQVKGQEAFIGVSIGAATWPQDGTTLSDVLSRADLAMYKAKSTGRDFIPYTQKIGSLFHREIELSQRLNQAIHKDQLHLVYQPKFYVATSEVAGFEALLRWNEPEFGSVSPAEFIPLAEKHNMMCPIGKWVIRTACQQLRQWQSEGIELPGRLAINISVQQLEHPDFFEGITNTIIEEGLSSAHFELEVTESVLMSDPEKAMNILKQLAHSGFCISIDDFGTGFSSLSYLKNINAKILKIDKSFINNITTNMHDQIIVKSMVDLAQNLGLSVVAEGVETEEQKRHLAELGCNMIQGYFYLRPVTADELIRKVSFRNSKSV